MVSRRKGNKTNGKPKQNLPAKAFAFLIVILLPIISMKSTIEPVIYPRFTFLAFSLIILVTGVWVFRKKYKPGIEAGNLLPVGLFSLYLFIIVISLFYSINPQEGLADVFKWFMFLVLIVLFQQLYSAKGDTKTILLKAILINVSFALLIGYFQLFEVLNSFDDPNVLYEIKGMMAHKNQYSISLFLLLPFLCMAIYHLPKGLSILSIILGVLLLFMLLILQTRAVWIAMLVFAIVVLFPSAISKIGDFRNLKSKIFKRPGLLVGGGAIILISILVFFWNLEITGKLVNRIGSVFDPEYTSNEWRLEMWDSTLKLISDNLWLGVGSGNWKINIYPYYSEYLPSVYRHWRSPHNDYLWILSEKGLPGLMVYVTAFFSVVVFGIKNYMKSDNRLTRLDMLLMTAGIFGYMIISFFSFPGERINHMLFVGIMMAIILSYPRKLKVENMILSLNSKYQYGLLLFLLYFPLHYGIVCVHSEINIKKAQHAYDAKQWQTLNKYADKGYSSIVPLEPKFSLPVVLYRGLASIHFDKDLNAGVEEFKKAYKQHPNHITVINNVGSVYGMMGDFENSALYFQKTLDIFPHYEVGLLNLSKAYYKKNDFVKSYQTLLSCDPRSSNPEINTLKNELEKRLIP